MTTIHYVMDAPCPETVVRRRPTTGTRRRTKCRTRSTPLSSTARRTSACRSAAPSQRLLGRERVRHPRQRGSLVFRGDRMISRPSTSSRATAGSSRRGRRAREGVLGRPRGPEARDAGHLASEMQEPGRVLVGGRADSTYIHMARFFDSVRTRKPTVEDGRRATRGAVAHMVNESVKRKAPSPGLREGRPEEGLTMERRSFLAALAGASPHASRLLAGAQPASPSPARSTPSGGRSTRAQVGVTQVTSTCCRLHRAREGLRRSRTTATEAFRTILPRLQELQKQASGPLRVHAGLPRPRPAAPPAPSRRRATSTSSRTRYYGAANDSACRGTRTRRAPASSRTAGRRGPPGIEGTGIAGLREDRRRRRAALRHRPQARRAGALCHLATGSPSPSTRETGGRAEILATLKAPRRLAGAYVWVTPRTSRTSRPAPGRRPRARGGARRGGPKSLEAHVEGVLDLARRNQLDRVLVSQDAGWYASASRGGS